MDWLQVPGDLALAWLSGRSPTVQILLGGAAVIAVLAGGGWVLWYGTQDRTGGAWRHRRPHTPLPWHRAPSGEYIRPVGAYRTRDGVRRHRAADLDSPTTAVRARAVARVRGGADVEGPDRGRSPGG